MGIYLSASTVSIYLAILVLRRIPFFADRKIWTFSRELAVIFIVLTASGISTYFMAFLVEEPSNRWNVITFLDSCKYAFLIGLFPFGLFTLSNIRHLFAEEITQLYSENKNQENEKEQKLHIISRLKKEELSFLPNHFIYAEAEGNYVNFHLSDNQKFSKILIRNSMNDIESQLAGIQFFFRTHRAFIVNLKKVKEKKGNSLGYKLRLYDTDPEIPVSRQKVQAFDQLLKQLK
jgi:hypothetical protein